LETEKTKFDSIDPQHLLSQLLRNIVVNLKDLNPVVLNLFLVGGTLFIRKNFLTHQKLGKFIKLHLKTSVSALNY